MRTLLIGGTGPTGPPIVKGLLERGHEVVIFHTGRHEAPEIPDEVEHIHADPWDPSALQSALAGRIFDLVIAGYGRLRAIAEITTRHCSRFISLGGGPAYLGYMNPRACSPNGMTVPIREDSSRVEREVDDEKGFRIARTEDAVFAHHPGATHFRYPIVYGPRQPLPREWSIVRRILDGRREIILPDGGLTLCHFGYAENLAHAVLLAVDRPEACAGRIYNCGDEDVLCLRQVVELIAEALDHPLEIISIPYELATPARPLIMQPLATHRVYDLSRLRTDLGYRDVVPACEAIKRTAHWLVENRPEKAGSEETVLQDPFDYAAEDQLISAWRSALHSLPEIRFEREPGYTLSYSGPGGRAPSSTGFE